MLSVNRFSLKGGAEPADNFSLRGGAEPGGRGVSLDSGGIN